MVMQAWFYERQMDKIWLQNKIVSIKVSRNSQDIRPYSSQSD